MPGSVTGTLVDSGDQSFSLDYNTNALLAANEGYWTQTGSGNVTANATYNNSYSGAGSGSYSSGPEDVGPGSTAYANSAWSLSEHGGTSGTSTYTDALTLASGASAWSHASSFSSGSTLESACTFNASGSGGLTVGNGPPYSSGNSGSWSTSISDDEITNTTSTYDNSDGQWNPTTTFSGSGQENAYSSDADYGGYLSDRWNQTGYSNSWSPTEGGTAVSETAKRCCQHVRLGFDA